MCKVGDIKLEKYMDDLKKKLKSDAMTIQIKSVLEEICSSLDTVAIEKKEALLVMLQEWQYVNQRKYRRKMITEPVDYAVETRAYTGFIKNVGAGGAYIEGAVGKDIGEKIILTFSLPGLSKPFKTSGKIIWKDAHSFGVKFLGTSTYIEEHLTKLIETL